MGPIWGSFFRAPERRRAGNPARSAEEIAGFFENEFGHASLLVSENEIQYLKHVIDSWLSVRLAVAAQ